jgi:choice-of-anchor A domain-containing protein/uncharacterized repeat protein (TIGR01451 family)
MQNRFFNLMLNLTIIFLFTIGVNNLLGYDPGKGSKSNNTSTSINKITSTEFQITGTSTAKIKDKDKGFSPIGIKNPVTNKTMNIYAGTFKGTIDGEDASFFCIDLQHSLIYDIPDGSNPYTDAGVTSPEITYILNNYYPFKPAPAGSDINKEAAAVQISIWHFSDGIDVNTVSISTIKERSFQIIADAEANSGSLYPIATLQLLPSTQNNPQGTDAKFKVAAYDQNGNAVSGLNVILTASTGILSSSSTQTNNTGVTPEISLSQGTNSLSIISASANAAVPQGTRYVHCVEPNKYQKVVLATPVQINKKANGLAHWDKEQGECDTKGYTTFTQGGWGSPLNSQSGSLRDQYFSIVFPDGLMIGGTNKLVLSSALMLKNFFPQAGTAEAFSQNYSDVTSTSAGIFAGQIAALTLNLEFDKAGVTGLSPTNLGDLVIGSGVFAGKTVNQFLAIANQAIGGDGTNGYSFSQFSDAATLINENFDNGNTDKGYLSCEWSCTNSIGDFVWHDNNVNGIQDTNEVGIEGVLVQLLDNQNNVIKTTITSNTGFYQFAELPNDTYIVKVADINFQNGGVFYNTAYKKWYASPANLGNDDFKDSDGDENLHSISVSLDCNNNPTIDFGFFVTCVSLEKTGPTSANKGQEIKYHFKLENCGDLVLHGGAQIYDPLINPEGEHLIWDDIVEPGQVIEFDTTYTIKEEDCGQLINQAIVFGHPLKPDGTYVADISNISSWTTEVNCKASLGNRVWEDKNKNGIQDEAEQGVAGVTVKLFDCNENLLSTKLTDSQGYYLFDNLEAGQYHVKFELPTGYVFTSKDAGLDWIDSDADVITGISICTTLENGENDLTWDAGIYKDETSCVVNWSGNFYAKDSAICEIEKKWITVTAHVDLTPDNAKAKLQLAWRIVQPAELDSGTHYFSKWIYSDTTFSFAALWPGISSTDQVVEIHYGINVLDCNENPIHNGIGLDYYWYSWVCPPPPPDDADLELIKKVSNENPKNGDEITYSIIITNNGPKDVDNVEVKDVLPSGLEYLNSSATQGIYNSSTGIWTVGHLAKDETATLSINVKVNLNQMNNSYFDLGPAKGFNVFVLNNINQPSSDTEGKMAVGRSAELACYSVGDKLPNSNGSEDVLIVGENLTFHSGAVYGGNVVYGSSTNLPIYPVSINNGTLRKDYPIDFAAAATYLTNLSTQLSGYAVNGTAKFEWGGLFLKGTDPFLNVFSVSGSELSAANNFEIDAPNGSVVLVNIQGQDVSWTGGLVIYGTDKSNVLYNFYQATTLKIQGIDVRGSILAPFATVNFVTGVQNGQMIAKCITGQGQFNNTQFIGNIPVDHITNVAEIINSSKHDPDSTPNNGVETEDDYGKVIAHVSFDYNPAPGTNPDEGNWKIVGNFNSTDIISTLASIDGSLYAGVVGGTIFNSNDGGATWNKLNSLNTNSIWSIINKGNDIYAATETGLYRSGDKGITFEPVGFELQDVRNITSDADGNLYASIWGSGVYYSKDNGNNWQAINEGLTNLSVQKLIFNSYFDVYASTFGTGITRYNKTTNKWNELKIGYDYVWSLEKDMRGNLFAGTYGNGLYRSTDNGENWNKLNNLPAKYIYSIAVDGNENIYASSVANGVFVSKDGGNNWLSMGMSGFGISSMIVNQNSYDLLVGTTNGKIFMNVEHTTSIDKNMELPKEFELNQNYPNPFNPTTTIEFSISKREFVTLAVYNVLGQVVRALVDQELDEGNYSFTIDAHDLASGVYIYKLQSPTGSMTKKMILQK